MKRVIGIVLSVLLIAASVFGTVLSVNALSDTETIEEYHSFDYDAREAEAERLRDSVEEIESNQQLYFLSVGAFSDSSLSYDELSEVYGEEYAAYLEAYSEYVAAKNAVDETTRAYNESREMLAKIEPLMPYLNKYIEFCDGSLESLPGFDSAQSWFVSVVRPLGANLGLEIPEDVTDFPVYVQQYVIDTQASLKEYENELNELNAKLETATQAFYQAQKQVSESELMLDENGAVLADDAVWLLSYEGSEETLLKYCRALIEPMTPYCLWYSGEESVVSLAETMAENLDIEIPDDILVINDNATGNEPAYVLNEEAYALLCNNVADSMYRFDENGKVVTVEERDGFSPLDVEKCYLLIECTEEYLEARQTALTDELKAVETSCILSLAAAALCIACAIFVTVKNLMSSAAVLGIVGCVFGGLGAASAVAALVIGNMAPLRTVAMTAIVALAVLLIVLTAVFIATDVNKKAKAAQYGYNYMYYGK